MTTVALNQQSFSMEKETNSNDQKQAFSYLKESCLQGDTAVSKQAMQKDLLSGN